MADRQGFDVRMLPLPGRHDRSFWGAGECSFRSSESQIFIAASRSNPNHGHCGKLPFNPIELNTSLFSHARSGLIN
jgi:hypothetical protein